MKSIIQYKTLMVREKSFKLQDKLADNPAAVYQLLRTVFLHADRESFYVLALDAVNHVIGLNCVSIGTLTATLVHPREVFRFCIKANAAGCIVAHNHPSGDPAPSVEDKATTKRLKEAGAILGIPLLDHLVVGSSSFFSFRERGILE